MKRVMTVVLCALLFLSGCGPRHLDQEEKTTIVFLNSWGTMEGRQAVMRKIYEDFEAENPDIKLNMISMPSSEKVEDKVREMLQVGKLPNLIYTGGSEKNTLYPVMVEQGYALNLMPYIEADKEFKKMISPEIFKSYLTADNELYILTDILHMSGYWYNSKKFENAGITEIPDTWEKFIASCWKIEQWARENDSAVVPMNMNAETAAYLAEAYMAQGESQESNQEEKEEMFRKALENVKAIAETSALKDASFNNHDNIRDFNIGKTAIYVGGIWDEQVLNNNLNLSYASFPSETNESVGLVSANAGFLVGNTGTDEQKEACVRFLKYILSKPVQERIAREARLIPSNPEVDVESLFADKERLCEAYNAINGCQIEGRIPSIGWKEDAAATYNDNVINYMKNAISLDELVKMMKK